MNEAHCSRTSLISSASAQADAGGGGRAAAMMAVGGRVGGVGGSNMKVQFFQVAGVKIVSATAVIESTTAVV